MGASRGEALFHKDNNVHDYFEETISFNFSHHCITTLEVVSPRQILVITFIAFCASGVLGLKFESQTWLPRQAGVEKWQPDISLSSIPQDMYITSLVSASLSTNDCREWS